MGHRSSNLVLKSRAQKYTIYCKVCLNDWTGHAKNFPRNTVERKMASLCCGCNGLSQLVMKEYKLRSKTAQSITLQTNKQTRRANAQTTRIYVQNYNNRFSKCLLKTHHAVTQNIMCLIFLMRLAAMHP